MVITIEYTRPTKHQVDMYKNKIDKYRDSMMNALDAHKEYWLGPFEPKDPPSTRAQFNTNTKQFEIMVTLHMVYIEGEIATFEWGHIEPQPIIDELQAVYERKRPFLEAANRLALMGYLPRRRRSNLLAQSLLIHHGIPVE